MLNQKGIGDQFELELIIVDDCSTDRTHEIINELGMEYLCTGINSGGPNKGRNIGLGKATGDYICIADHDDEWNEDKIITLLPYLEKVPVVSSGYTLIDKNSERITDCLGEGEQEFVYYGVNISFISKFTRSLKGQKAYLGSLIYRIELKKHRFEENFCVVDFDWILSMLYQNDSIEVRKSLYKRYVDGTNLSLNHAYRIKDYYYSLMTIEKYRESYPKEYCTAYKKINGTRAKYYYLMNNMKLARFYFMRAGLSVKNLAYYLTTYVGSDFVKKKFNVFG
jgi:glycosyltransferase involved in cell wall biosynthesis